MTEVEKQVQNRLQEIAKEIDKRLPENFGFTLLAYEFGEGKEKKMLYASNCNRKDVEKAMKEWIATVNDENFGKDI